jgi:leader peptidase (prepilin peptidase)/N-methyltransferase
VTVLLGAASFAALAGRFTDPAELVLFTLWFGALLVLLATDLDQHLLPDLITLPLIPIGVVVALVGPDPLVHDAFGFAGAAAIAVVLPLGLFLLSIPFGAGAIAMGDLKLLVSIGLLSGLVRTLIGVVTGTFVVGLVIVALLAGRRVTLKSYIPFGPMLIIGAMWGVLVRFA